jgi:hypothetical protein
MSLGRILGVILIEGDDIERRARRIFLNLKREVLGGWWSLCYVFVAFLMAFVMALRNYRNAKVLNFFSDPSLGL